MIAVVDYNAGNTRSVLNALNRIGAESIMTADRKLIAAADKVIFPGVGEASSTMDHLRSVGLDEVLPELTVPFLGICLGMQLMCSHSEEGNTKCLGIFDAAVRKFPPGDKVPHMGWNTISFEEHDLFRGLPSDPDVYFVHSFFVEMTPDAIATSMYQIEFSSAISKANFHAVQFHPEKSADIGQTILKNFLAL